MENSTTKKGRMQIRKKKMLLGLLDKDVAIDTQNFVQNTHFITMFGDTWC